ncbi:MAG: glycosyltransferase [Thermoanaerobaculia bacterium]
MARIVTVDEPLGLYDYESYAHLAPAVQRLRSEAAPVVSALRGHRVWMINSTEKGGGVAEMLPRMVSIMRELGVESEWAVIETDRQDFFAFTKRMHNLIHGVGDSSITGDERRAYEEVNRANVGRLTEWIHDGDLVVVHDPQPMALAGMIRERRNVRTVWRCHIGLDRDLPQTRAAWEFLEPYSRDYDDSVFTAVEYIPGYLSGRAVVVHPGIDPLSHKNRDLTAHKLQGILCNSRLAVEHAPVLTPPFAETAKRLSPAGEWVAATEPQEIGLLYRPIVAQISRWDRLKGFGPLLDGFVRLKRRGAGPANTSVHAHRLQIARLVLAGPDPESVTDDPEGREVLEELKAKYVALPPDLQQDIALVALPMGSRKQNALMVNAIQRCATVMVQNSLQEGFGLTVTEALWKRSAVVGSRAVGIRQQIRDGVDGKLVGDPSNAEEIAQALDEVLRDPKQRESFGASGQRRVYDEFLVFSQLRRWFRIFGDLARRARNGS